jgi:hypothetical protein
VIVSLGWFHLLTLDLFMARYISQDAAVWGVLGAHSVLLAFFFGPLGLLSHIATKTLAQMTRGVTRRQLADGESSS